MISINYDEKTKFIKLAFNIVLDQSPSDANEQVRPLIENMFSDAFCKNINAEVLSMIAMLDETEVPIPLINDILSSHGLPEYIYFKALQKDALAKILKKRTLRKGSDAILLRDAREAGSLTAEETVIADRLLLPWA